MARAKALRRPLEIGDFVKRRGPFDAVGAVEKKVKNWCFVKWGSGSGRNPRILDEDELEAVER